MAAKKTTKKSKSKKTKSAPKKVELKKFKKGDQVTWEVTGRGSRFEVTGQVVAHISPGEDFRKKLPKSANKIGGFAEHHGAGIASGRVKGQPVTDQDRYLVQVSVEESELPYFYTPRTVTLSAHN